MDISMTMQMWNRRSSIRKTDESIVTTLDVGVQQIVEKYVNGFKEAMGAKNIGADRNEAYLPVRSLPWMAGTAMI